MCPTYLFDGKYLPAKQMGSNPGLGRFPGEGIATHSGILAWEIPWTEEPSGLQFLGLQNPQDLATKQQQHSSLTSEIRGTCMAAHCLLK